MLILAFDTATSVATAALVRDGEVLGEATAEARALLDRVDSLLRAAGAEPRDLAALAVGIGPGSFTGVRIGLAAARGLALGLDLPAAGVSTLDALAAGSAGAVPVIDARRKEVFVLDAGKIVATPWERLPVVAGSAYVGDGALRYREHIEAGGGVVPAEDDERHVPRARYHALLAHDFADADLLEPLYVRVPDAEKTVA